jgi:adenylosuccinate synthase
MDDLDYFLKINYDHVGFTHYLRKIRDEYVPTRIDLNELSERNLTILNSEMLIEDYIEACEYMLEHVKFANIRKFENNTLIFEGAQGLLLDMDYGYFPHVTRSNCGMKNISNILEELYNPELDVTVNYVTRAYTTRHGAGPLNYEVDNLPHNIVDKTNIMNEFQGSLRFAPLDISLFESITDKDFLNYAPRSAKKVTTVTCMDQLGENYNYLQNGEELSLTTDAFTYLARQYFDFSSWGPTRDTIEDHHE